MLLLTFSKAGCDDITLTEDDLFDFEYEAGCFSGETFELGGVNARSIYLLIDNNDRRFSRGTFANTRITLEIDGNFYGRYNAELPKRRDGVIELTAYDDMTKLDIDFPEDFIFPAPFPTVYANCVYEAGLAPDKLHENVVLNAVLNNGLIADDYDEYVYANSCRKVVAGMAEWNGGFAYINNDNKLQVDAFSKEVKKTLYSGDLMELDYSDETVTFSKVRTSQKNKTYEMGDDSGYTLVINNQYISYGLTDAAFEMYLTYLYEYYNGFTLTPMSFVLAEPDFELKLGDRISVVDEEEDITVTGNISKITISGNCSMSVTCGGFGNVASANNYTPTSVSQTAQAKTEAVQQVTSTASSLYEYEYLTDLSAKCNGVTYTAEKDETGLISKISDNAGNAIEPTISGDITGIEWHNAVLMAVAISRGLGKSALMPILSGIVGYFDFTVCNGTNWRNLVNLNAPMSLTNASVTADGVHLAAGAHYGTFVMAQSPRTIYCIYRTTEATNPQLGELGGWQHMVAPSRNTHAVKTAFCISTTAANYITLAGQSSDVISAISPLDSFHAVAVVRQDDGMAALYIDGTLIGAKEYVDTGYTGTVHVGRYVDDVDDLYALIGMDCKHISIGATPHSAEQVAENSAWLRDHYGIT